MPGPDVLREIPDQVRDSRENHILNLQFVLKSCHVL